MEFECSFFNMSSSKGTKYTCKVHSVTSSKPNAPIKLARGTHLAGKTNDDVDSLWINGQVFERIPKGIPQLFPKLTNLLLRDCGLKEISKSDLVGLEKLLYLEISDNPIKSLPDDLFTNMKNLRWIYCYGNHIDTLSSKIFDPIKDNDLQQVTFTRNPKLNARFDVKTAETLEKLMATIDQTCTPPTRPRTQAAEWMKIILIARKFSDFTIKVKDKELEKIHIEMEFECEFLNIGWDNRRKYTCTVKSITNSEPNALIKLAHGTHLADKTNDDVEFLWMSNQVFERIPKGIPQLFPKLTNLYLWNCGLKEISKSDFVGLEKLEFLFICGNPLKSLPTDLFTNMKNLRWFYCNGNQIETLSSKIFDPIKDNNLQSATFTNNPKLNAYFHVNTEETLEKLKTTIDQTCTPPTQPRTQAVEWTQSIPENMKLILIAREFSDFSIIVKDKEFLVHKFVFASQSSVFKKMFSDDAEEGAKIFKDIKDFSAEVLQDFIDYFYTGIIRNEDVAVQLLELASQFDVPQLKTMCEEAILENLKEDNAQEIYNLGCSSSIKLKQGAFAVLQKLIPELAPDSMNNAELVNEIIEARNQLENLIKRQASVKD